MSNRYRESACSIDMAREYGLTALRTRRSQCDGRVEPCLTPWFPPSAYALEAGLLGFDLVRLQHRLRSEAADRRFALESMANEYGGIAAWAEEIKRSVRWIPGSACEDYHAEDPLSFNVQNLSERAGELGDCVNGLGEHVAKLTTYLSEAAEADTSMAALSSRYSVAGPVLLFAGFVLQTLGTNL